VLCFMSTQRIKYILFRIQSWEPLVVD
jgi:hypothetical protein